jgi:hypothetical protein
MASTSAPQGWRAELEAFALRVANAGAEGPPSDGPTFRGLDSEDRAAVHDAARKLGLASKSEGSDDDGTRSVRVFARKRPAWTHASAGMANGDARASAAEADDTAAADASPHGPSAFDESLADLRDAPFDMYKALRIPRREGGGYSGGTARARASYHREAVRCYPTSDAQPGRGACDGCGGALRLGRWMHRPAPPRADAPADDPEFGLMDDEEDDGGDAIVASAVSRGVKDDEEKQKANTRRGNESTPETSRLRRRDLCPPCFARMGGGVSAADPRRASRPSHRSPTSGASARGTTSRRTRRSARAARRRRTRRRRRTLARSPPSPAPRRWRARRRCARRKRRRMALTRKRHPKVSRDPRRKRRR